MRLVLDTLRSYRTFYIGTNIFCCGSIQRYMEATKHFSKSKVEGVPCRDKGESV